MRLSKEQKDILLMAYQRYREDPYLAPAGTPFGGWPMGSGAPSPKIGVAHITLAYAILVRCKLLDKVGEGTIYDALSNHRQVFKRNRWWWNGDIPDIPKTELNRHRASISRSLKRLENNGLVDREDRVVQLTDSGIALAEKLSGIACTQRQWKMNPNPISSIDALGLAEKRFMAKRLMLRTNATNS